MGMGANLEAELMNNPETVDLLICIAYACAANPNHFHPFPNEVYIEKGKNEKYTSLFSSSPSSFSSYTTTSLYILFLRLLALSLFPPLLPPPPRLPFLLFTM